jgi:hypothetical protein
MHISLFPVISDLSVLFVKPMLIMQYRYQKQRRIKTLKNIWLKTDPMAAVGSPLGKFCPYDDIIRLMAGIDRLAPRGFCMGLGLPRTHSTILSLSIILLAF